MTMLRFPQGELPDVVYVEQFAGACYFGKPADTDRYLHVLNRLGTAASPPEAAGPMLTAIGDQARQIWPA